MLLLRAECTIIISENIYRPFSGSPEPFDPLFLVWHRISLPHFNTFCHSWGFPRAVAPEAGPNNE